MAPRFKPLLALGGVFVALVLFVVLSGIAIAAGGTGESPVLAALWNSAPPEEPASALAGTCTVTSTADSGPGTLRTCLENAVSGDLINFDPGIFPPASPVSITVASDLPSITQGNLTIDASDTGVILDGSSVVPNLGEGLYVISDGNLVRGLQIFDFPGDGIEIYNGSNNTIADNVISGNGLTGVSIAGSSATGNRVFGNRVGTDASGTMAIGGHPLCGVRIGGGARYNTIGGDTEDERNLISGNDDDGVCINDSGTMSNTVSGNYIGTDINGTMAIPNASGVSIGSGAQYNTVGGSNHTPGGACTGECNLLSGNGGGVLLIRNGTNHNVISGNYIGTDPTGTFAVPNTRGIWIVDEAQHNVIGGTTPGERNVISGNTDPVGGPGIWIEGPGADYNVVIGNHIGTDARGLAAIPNDGGGVAISDGAGHNTVGGSTLEERNLISGNNRGAVGISGVHNAVIGNYIGVDVTGLVALGNGGGVGVEGTYNRVGGATPGERNIISGNDAGAVYIENSGTMSNTVLGNYIGTDIHGTAAIPNGWGVQIWNGAQRNTVGGSAPGEGNLISGNSGDGIIIQDNETFTNTVSGNYIGTTANGTAALANDGYGIHIHSAASHNLVGGDAPGEGNLISGNASGGVGIGNGDSNYNLVTGNLIGTDASGTMAIPNSGEGVSLWWNASWNTVGISNTIAFNAGHGVSVDGGGTLYNTITRNSIHSNTGQGIALSDGGNGNLSAPTVLAFDSSSGTASGTALPGCTVEAYSDAGDEGRWFEGKIVADGGGIWAFSKGNAFVGPYVHATCTDTSGNTSEFSPEVPDTCPLVSSPADSGAGTLRQCLAQADAGDTIRFSPTVFPPEGYTIISPTTGLPQIITDDLTIDASDTRVILSGQRIGSTPETMWLDDVSLTFDDGGNVLLNGEFEAGLGHWRAADEGSGATRSLNSSDSHSPPNSYQWDVVAHSGGSSTVYDRTDSSDPIDDPFDEGSTTWITATGVTTLELRFWYKGEGVAVEIKLLYPADDDALGNWSFNSQSNWTEAVIKETLPAETVAVALEFKRTHSLWGTAGLSISADRTAIQGLWIGDFPGDGIVLHGGAEENLIGGQNANPGGICSGECNLIVNNMWAGIELWDSGTLSNTISGNYIGTYPNGSGDAGNAWEGVLIWYGPSHNIVGGDTPSERNLISGNREAGIRIEGSESTANTISGNYIGTDATGTFALGNGNKGIKIGYGTSGNVVGGSAPGEGNLISGNEEDGVHLEDGSRHNVVSGNYIGTDADGTYAVPNTTNGVRIDESPENTIGGDTAAERNLISGNLENGIRIEGSESTTNTISGNYIGTDVSGTSLVPNGYIGVVVASSTHNVIGGINGSPGGDCTGECNLVSGNAYGVEMFYATNITVTGNYIGTDASGTAWLSSNVVQVGGAYNRIGGITPGERNVLAGPLWIAPPYEGPHHHQIIGNYIGVDATGTTCIGQGWGGIGVGGSDHVVGGDTPEEGNRICGYDHWSISVSGTDNVVGHNTVYGSSEDGILVTGSDNLLANNEICDNAGDGVEVRGETALRNTITENSLHDNEGQGLRLVDGGNEELDEPLVTAVDLGAGTLSGTACAGCRVEVFSDDEDEGRVFEAFVMADGAGSWSFDKGSAFTLAHVTATATDGEGNTSEFSRPARPPVDLYVDGTAPPGGDGSPESPFQRVGEALDASFIGDTVHIADGTYLENIEIGHDLTLLGGYSGLGDPFWVRDPDLYDTVLDGSGNPTILGDWDSGQFGMPHVVWDAHVGEYKMYYTASGTNHPFAIGLATSPDGIDWERHPDNPILMSNPGTWEGDLVQEAYVRIEGSGNYKMWYDNGSNIGYATSTDGIHWDKRPDPVFEPAPGSWDSFMVRTPSVVWTGSQYLMAYEGHDGSWDLYAGVATSLDGITWTRYAGNPILGAGDPGAFDEYGIYRLDMAHDGSEYRMIYGGDGSGPLGLGIATSPDGFNWTRHPDNPIFGAGTEPWENWSAWSAGLLWDDPMWKLYYAGVGEVGYAIGLATANDGVHFVRDSEHNPCLSPGNPGQEGAPTVQVVGAGSVVLEDLTLTGGYYWDGGGLNMENAHVTLRGCSVVDNGTIDDGGGIQATADSTLEMYASVLTSNAAGGAGGGLDANDGTTVLMEGVVVEGNRAEGGAGGGLLLSDLGTSANLREVLVNKNEAAEGGAGIDLRGEPGPEVTLEAVEVAGNVSRWGAGLRLGNGSRVRGDRVWIVANTATEGGSGGFEVESGSALTLTNALITRNAGGAGAVTTSSTLTLTNVTVADNSRGDGGGGIGVYDASSAAVLNGILFFNGDWDLACDGTSTCLVESSDLEHPWAGPGNISEDPLFVDPVHGDYHLQISSPCVDTASAAYAPDHDIDGESRPFDGDGSGVAEPDMGADEYVGAPAVHDVSVLGASPGGDLQVGVPVIVTTDLFNGGNLAEDQVPVQCTIWVSGAEVYRRGVQSGLLTPATYALLELPDWMPEASGPYTVTCESQLPGDAKPTNDAFTRTGTVVLSGEPDVWSKDNVADSGDVPSESPWWVSPDIWVRHAEDGGLVHENPIAFQENTVYVRVRNRGEAPASGEVGVYWDRSRIGWPCKVEAPNVGTIPFEDLAPGEARILSIAWTPEEPGEHGLHTVIEAEGDPADWSAPCSPHRPRWDNNVSWHNVIVYLQTPQGTREAEAMVEAEVDLVNPYDWPKEVDLILGRGTFPATGSIRIHLAEPLFDRWQANGGPGAGIEVGVATKVITVTAEISATIGGLPLAAREEATATLALDAPQTGAFEVMLQEVIDGLVVGGITYQWVDVDTVPPEVVSTSPPAGAADVALDVPLVLTFTEPMGPLSFNLTLAPGLGDWQATWNGAGTVVTVTHSGLAPGQTYTAGVTAGDAWANPLAPYSWSFATIDGWQIYLPMVVRNH